MVRCIKEKRLLKHPKSHLSFNLQDKNIKASQIDSLPNTPFLPNSEMALCL